MDGHQVVEIVKKRLLELDMQFSQMNESKDLTKAQRKKLEQIYDLYNQNFRIYRNLTGQEFVPPSKSKIQ